MRSFLLILLNRYLNYETTKGDHILGRLLCVKKLLAFGSSFLM